MSEMKKLVLLLSMTALGGCGGPMWIVGDSWHEDDAEIPSGMMGDSAQAVPHWPVAAGEQAAAKARLEESEAVSLSEEEARQFVGHVPGSPAEGRPYLVRAVYTFMDPGGFSAYFHEGCLRINHHMWGARTAWRLKRFALVVRLKQPPADVILTCSGSI
jgi:hypothetical protein